MSDNHIPPPCGECGGLLWHRKHCSKGTPGVLRPDDWQHASSIVDSLRAELNAALADNAALVEALPVYGEHCLRAGYGLGSTLTTNLKDDFAERVRTICKSVLAAPHPGAPLLKELAKLREDVKDCHDRCMEKCGAELADLRERLKKAERERDVEKAAADKYQAQRDASIHAMDAMRVERDDLRTKLATVERERDEGREMLEGSVTDATWAAWRESADVRIAEEVARAEKAEVRVRELETALREVAGFFENSRRAELKGAREYDAAFMRALVMGVVDAALSQPTQPEAKALVVAPSGGTGSVLLESPTQPEKEKPE